MVETVITKTTVLLCFQEPGDDTSLPPCYGICFNQRNVSGSDVFHFQAEKSNLSFSMTSPPLPRIYGYMEGNDGSMRIWIPEWVQ